MPRAGESSSCDLWSGTVRTRRRRSSRGGRTSPRCRTTSRSHRFRGPRSSSGRRRTRPAGSPLRRWRTREDGPLCVPRDGSCRGTRAVPWGVPMRRARRRARDADPSAGSRVVLLDHEAVAACARAGLPAHRLLCLLGMPFCAVGTKGVLFRRRFERLRLGRGLLSGTALGGSYLLGGAGRVIWCGLLGGAGNRGGCLPRGDARRL